MERKRVTYSNSYLFNKTKIYTYYPILLKKGKQFKHMNSSNVTMFEAKLEIYLYPHKKNIIIITGI